MLCSAWLPYPGSTNVDCAVIVLIQTAREKQMRVEKSETPENHDVEKKERKIVWGKQ